MPPRMITRMESDMNATAWWFWRKAGNLANTELFSGSSTCDSSAITPDCCVSL